MRKFLISVAATASTVALAAPASAQWYPPQPRGYAYGHPANMGLARAMQVRIDRIQRDIGYLAANRMISRKEYHNLRAESRDIERSLRRNARDGYGLSRQEAYRVERKIARLEYKIARDVRDGRRWGFRW